MPFLNILTPVYLIILSMIIGFCCGALVQQQPEKESELEVPDPVGLKLISKCLLKTPELVNEN